MVPLGTASDGGGSTRIPAGFSGLVGLKASYGRIPSPGPGNRGSLTAVLGALTTTVRDSARHLDVAAGPDDRDRTSLPPAGVTYEDAIERLDVAGLRARWSPDLGFAAVEPEVARAGRPAPPRPWCPPRAWSSTTIRWCSPTPCGPGSARGAVDLWLELRARHVARPRRRAHRLLAPLARCHAPTRRCPPHAAHSCTGPQLEADVAALFDEVDVLLTPTTAVAAFPAGGPSPAVIDGVEVSGAMSVPFAMLANLCWNPSISVPAGLTSAGLPVGLLITARRHADDVALRLARIFEQARPWPRFAPPRS